MVFPYGAVVPRKAINQSSHAFKGIVVIYVANARRWERRGVHPFLNLASNRIGCGTDQRNDKVAIVVIDAGEDGWK
jgi:hypothetical protein